MDCKEHKKLVEDYNGGLKELANDIGDLHYEALSVFLGNLALKINSDAFKDFEGGRKKLARTLFEASSSLRNASDTIWESWEISKPFMK
jgi:hypothetical protein